MTQLLGLVAEPNRPAATLGTVVPGYAVGDPLREGWDETRGTRVPVSFTNRNGALLSGNVFAPRDGATDPHTGETLNPPYPGVVIAPGSDQGVQQLYFWLPQDLAERGYVVLTFDTQGQGQSETFPHLAPVEELPFCNPASPPTKGEITGCPGVPSQQGASQLQGTDERISAVLALDKLVTNGGLVDGGGLTSVDGPIEPVVPALALQADYGFSVLPYTANHESSLSPQPMAPTVDPDPRREQRTGFDGWRATGIDTMLVVPRAATHLDYASVPLVLPASRYGQALSSHYAQAWLDKYLGGNETADARLLATEIDYLEPVAPGPEYETVTLQRADQLSFYFCSGVDVGLAEGGRAVDTDLGGAGCPQAATVGGGGQERPAPDPADQGAGEPEAERSAADAGRARALPATGGSAPVPAALLVVVLGLSSALLLRRRAD